MRKDRKKLRELGKDLLIVLLIVSALLLGRETGLLGGLFTGLGGSAQGEAPDGGAVTAAADPFAVAVTGSQGRHYGLTHGADRVAELYGRFSAALGEALGSSGAPEEVTETDWQAALSGTGVYFDFLYVQPLSVLAVWLGTDIAGGAADHAARRICLALEADGIALYYIRARSGGYYRCATALSASALAARIDEYTPNGAGFVWELGADEALDPYALLEDGLQSYAQVSVANPLRDVAALEALQALFGFTVARNYTESDGTSVYVEGDATLRVTAAGAVSYRCTEGGLTLGGASMSAQAAVEAARMLCQRGPGAAAGAGSLGLSDLRYDQETGTYTVCFEYAVDGVPVRLMEGPAVELTIAQGLLQEATMRFRSYSLRPETVTPLPAAQALAVVRASGGGEPLLAYVDDYSAVTLQWLAA